MATGFRSLRKLTDKLYKARKINAAERRIEEAIVKQRVLPKIQADIDKARDMVTLKQSEARRFMEEARRAAPNQSQEAWEGAAQAIEEANKARHTFDDLIKRQQKARIEADVADRAAVGRIEEVVRQAAGVVGGIDKLREVSAIAKRVAQASALQARYLRSVAKFSNEEAVKAIAQVERFKAEVATLTKAANEARVITSPQTRFAPGARELLDEARFAEFSAYKDIKDANLRLIEAQRLADTTAAKATQAAARASVAEKEAIYLGSRADRAEQAVFTAETQLAKIGSSVVIVTEINDPTALPPHPLEEAIKTGAGYAVDGYKAVDDGAVKVIDSVGNVISLGTIPQVATAMVNAEDKMIEVGGDRLSELLEPFSEDTKKQVGRNLQILDKHMIEFAGEGVFY